MRHKAYLFTPVFLSMHCIGVASVIVVKVTAACGSADPWGTRDQSINADNRTTLTRKNTKKSNHPYSIHKTGTPHTTDHKPEPEQSVRAAIWHRLVRMFRRDASRHFTCLRLFSGTSCLAQLSRLYLHANASERPSTVSGPVEWSWVYVAKRTTQEHTDAHKQDDET